MNRSLSKSRTLKVQRETVRSLSAGQLAQAAGGVKGATELTFCLKTDVVRGETSMPGPATCTDGLVVISEGWDWGWQVQRP